MRLTTFQNVGWHEILKIVVSEDPPQTPLGELTTFPQIPSSWVASCLRQSQLRAFGSCNFTDSPLQVLVGSPGSRSQFVHSGPPILNSRIHLVYDSIICVELMNYGYLCIVCVPTQFMFMDTLDPIHTPAGSGLELSRCILLLVVRGEWVRCSLLVTFAAARC